MRQLVASQTPGFDTSPRALRRYGTARSAALLTIAGTYPLRPKEDPSSIWPPRPGTRRARRGWADALLGGACAHPDMERLPVRVRGGASRFAHVSARRALVSLGDPCPPMFPPKPWSETGGYLALLALRFDGPSVSPVRQVSSASTGGPRPPSAAPTCPGPYMTSTIVPCLARGPARPSYSASSALSCPVLC